MTNPLAANASEAAADPMVRTHTGTACCPNALGGGVHVHVGDAPYARASVPAPLTLSTSQNWYSSGVVLPDTAAVQVMGVPAATGRLGDAVRPTSPPDRSAR